MRLSTLVLLAALPVFAVAAEPAPLITPKVVIVSMFEVDADTGDKPGEFQYWVERESLTRVIPLPAAYHDVRSNADGSVIGIVTGAGNTNATASIMALGLDPRFDLRQSYWLVAGIAGIDPADASIGSAVWADYLVEGDLAHEIDPREIPAGWSTGYLPLGKRSPYEQPRKPRPINPGEVFQLNPGLVNWAYQLTKDTPLADSAGMKKRRDVYTDTPKGRQPPGVSIGANLAASTYWHGRLLNAWANDWVRYQTENRANYVTCAMEDTGTASALTYLSRAGRVDVQRLLVLRTGSNFDSQWPGATAIESLSGEHVGAYSAYIPSLEAAHQVGSQVVHALVAGWDRYATELPKP